MPTDAERDPVERAQHSVLVAISVARTVLDLAEAAVADRERLERLATSGRSFAETWLGDAARIATAVASGFGFETEAKPSAPPAPARPAEQPAAKATPARAAGPTGAKRPAKRANARPRPKAAKMAPKKQAKARKATPKRPKKRMK